MGTAESELALPHDSKPRTKASGGWASELLSILRTGPSSTPRIPTGLDRQGLIEANKSTIMDLLGATETEWNDWEWQMANRTGNAQLLAGVLNLTDEDTRDLESSWERRHWSTTPHYLSLMSPDPECPIRLQVVGTRDTQTDAARIGSMTFRRWRGMLADVRDRIGIIRISGDCAVKCRYCSFCGRDGSGSRDPVGLMDRVEGQILRIKENPGTRHILVTGGDPLLLPDGLLGSVLDAVAGVPGLTGVSIDTRTPAVLPQRVTEGLVAILGSKAPMTLVTQFNSPLEVTAESMAACRALLSRGIVLQNRPFILPGVNDRKFIMKKLRDVLREMGFSHTRRGPIA